MERVIADRFELEQKIGSGGMGTVWKARDTLLDRTVAVKCLHDGLASDADFSERFRREARSAARLGHPNVVAVYDTGEENGIPFIVMEYVEGQSLHLLLNRHGPLPVEDTARIARSILAGLAHAHSRGLIHRDMKPANVLFDSGTGEAKVVDFGIAKGLDDTGGLTRTSGLIGTAAYLSPEQVSGNDATQRSDLYAVGCLLYACLAGEAPFSGPTPVAIAMRHINEPVPSLRSRRPDVPPGFEAVIMRALDKDPARRFASAQQMDAAVAATGLDTRPPTDPMVNEVATGAPTMVGAMREHPVAGRGGTEVIDRGGAPAGTGRWLAALTAFLLVAAATAILVLYLQNREREPGEVLVPGQTATAPPVTEAPATPSPTAAPTQTPAQETAGPLDGLPGLGGRLRDNRPDEPEETPEPTPSPTPEETEEP